MVRWKYIPFSRVKTLNSILLVFVFVQFLALSSATTSKSSQRQPAIQAKYALFNSTISSDFNHLSSKFLSKRISSLNDKHSTGLKSAFKKTANKSKNKKQNKKTKTDAVSNNHRLRQAPVPAPVDPLAAIAPFTALLPFSIAPIVYVLFAFVITNLSLASVNRGTLTANLDQAQTVLDNINSFTGLGGRTEKLEKKHGRLRNSTAESDEDISQESQELWQKLGVAKNDYDYNHAVEDSALDIMLSKVTLGNLIRILGIALAVGYAFEIRPGPALVISTIFIGAILWTRIIADQSRINYRSLQVYPRS